MNDAEKIIEYLDREIEEKCNEIKRKKHECLMTSMFILICVAALTVPALPLIFGISFTSCLLPLLVLSALILSAALTLSDFGGSLNE